MYDKTRKLYGLIGLTVVIKNVIIKMPKGSVATSHMSIILGGPTNGPHPLR